MSLEKMNKRILEREKRKLERAVRNAPEGSPLEHLIINIHYYLVAHGRIDEALFAEVDERQLHWLYKHGFFNHSLKFEICRLVFLHSTDVKVQTLAMDIFFSLQASSLLKFLWLREFFTFTCDLEMKKFILENIQRLKMKSDGRKQKVQYLSSIATNHPEEDLRQTAIYCITRSLDMSGKLRFTALKDLALLGEMTTSDTTHILYYIKFIKGINFSEILMFYQELVVDSIDPKIINIICSHCELVVKDEGVHYLVRNDFQKFLDQLKPEQ